MSVLAVAPAPVRTETAAGRPQPGYFQRPLPVYLILGSFVFLTLPLAALALLNPVLLSRSYLGTVYVAVFGTTHFLLTLTIYLQSANLRYFGSTWMNRVCYFLVPLSIFVFFDLYRTLGIAVLWPVLDLFVRLGIRLMDFHHFGRQNYGMMQLFKGRSRCPFPAWARKAESGYFLGLTALLMLTFLGGVRFDATGWPTRLALECVGCLFLVTCAGFVCAWRRADDRRALLVPLAYFTLQTGSAALGIYSSSLYLFCLAMHYVEYHVVMVPRCFATSLDAGSRTDRLFRRLRQNRAVFYLALLAAAAVVTYCTWIAMGAVLSVTNQASSRPYLALISLFDGLFVFHYFIEAFIWRFSDPYYRQTLGPLYFGQRPKAGVRD